MGIGLASIVHFLSSLPECRHMPLPGPAVALGNLDAHTLLQMSCHLHSVRQVSAQRATRLSSSHLNEGCRYDVVGGVLYGC